MAVPVEITIRSTGVDGVQRDLRLVKSEMQSFGAETQKGEAISHSAARGLGELGRGLGNVAQSGELGAFALREFTGAAFRLGAEVGSAGLGAAIGLTVLAIGTLVEAFGKAGESAKKANQEFQSYIETLVHGSVVEASLAKAKLYSGDPTAMLTGRRDGESDIAFHGRAGGQQYLEAEQARLTALKQESDRLTNTGTTATTPQMQERKALIAQLKEVTDLLNQNDLNLTRVSGVYDELLKKEKELAAFQLEQLRAKATGHRAGQVDVPFSTTERADYYASQLREYRNGLMGDQINSFGFGPKGEKGLFVGGQITGLKIKAAQIPPDMFLEGQDEIVKQWEKTQQRIAETINSGLAGALTDGITAAATKGFAAGGEAFLAGIGGMLERVGEVTLSGLSFMKTIQSAIASFNPVFGIPAALGLIALGAAIKQAASHAAMGNGGSSYGSGGGYSPASAYQTQQSIAGATNRKTTVVFKGSAYAALFANPAFREEFTDGIRELSNAGDLDFLFED